jgi:chromosomal replication initiation ATPase DnaA
MVNGLGRKLSESRAASSTCTRSQKKRFSNNQKPKRHVRDDKDIAEVTAELERLEVLQECRQICKSRGVLLRAALGAGRSKTVVVARDDIVAFLVQRFGYSSPECGAVLKMNHATVLTSLERTKARQKP